MPRSRPPADHAFDETLGRRIRQRRIALGLSQADLASRIGVSFQQVQKYEHGANRISGARLTNVAEILGVPPAWFFGTAEAAPPLDDGDRFLMEHQRRFAALPKPVQVAVANLTRDLANAYGAREFAPDAEC